VYPEQKKTRTQLEARVSSVGGLSESNQLAFQSYSSPAQLTSQEHSLLVIKWSKKDDLIPPS